MFNDSEVRRIPAADVVTSDAYVLFYCRVQHTGSATTGESSTVPSTDTLDTREVVGPRHLHRDARPHHARQGSGQRLAVDIGDEGVAAATRNLAALQVQQRSPKVRAAAAHRDDFTDVLAGVQSQRRVARTANVSPRRRENTPATIDEDSNPQARPLHRGGGDAPLTPRRSKPRGGGAAALLLLTDDTATPSMQRAPAPLPSHVETPPRPLVTGTPRHAAPTAVDYSRGRDSRGRLAVDTTGGDSIAIEDSPPPSTRSARQPSASHRSSSKRRAAAYV